MAILFCGRFFVSNLVDETDLLEAQQTVNTITNNKMEELEMKGTRQWKRRGWTFERGPNP